MDWTFRHVCVSHLVELNTRNCATWSIWVWKWGVREFVLLALATKNASCSHYFVMHTKHNTKWKPACLHYQVKEWVNTDSFLLQIDPLAKSSSNLACCFVWVKNLANYMKRSAREWGVKEYSWTSKRGSKGSMDRIVQ